MMQSRTRYGWCAGTVLVCLAACSKPESSSRDVPSNSTGSSELTPGSAGTRSAGTSGAGTSSANPNQHSYLCPKDVASSGGTAASDLFSPSGLSNVGLDETAALEVYASTLKAGPKGLELYVAVCNQSDWYQCSGAMQVELYDDSQQVLATVSNAVQSGRLFRFTESPYPISCVAPGEVGMAAVTEFPEGFAIEDIKSLGYRFSVFQLDVAEPIEDARVSQVEAHEVAAGTAFRGTVTNDSDSPVTGPSVSVFPITESGRPLGNAQTSAVIEIPPNETWSFETSAVAERGVGQVAFALATPSKAP